MAGQESQETYHRARYSPRKAFRQYEREAASPRRWLRYSAFWHHQAAGDSEHLQPVAVPAALREPVEEAQEPGQLREPDRQDARRYRAAPCLWVGTWGAQG